MEITYYGHSCFLIKGKKTRVVTDPFGEAVGFKQTKVQADIVTVSHEHADHNDLSQVEGEPMVIRGPGEYEIKGVSIMGIASYHDKEQGKKRGQNTIYTIDMGELRVCHLGDLGCVLSESQLNLLDGVDVLLAPVGGVYTLNPEEAMEVIKQVGPAIVVPMHYRVPGMKPTFDKIATLKEFLQAADGDKHRREKKLSIKKPDLPEEMEIVLLERI